MSRIRAGEVLGCPLLVHLPGVAWAALTEADLTDWAGLYFTGTGVFPAAVVSRLAPRLDDAEVCVRSRAPSESPWRVVLIGRQPGDLIESELILNLNDPCELEDTSWIRPGISAWDRWWCGSYAPDAVFDFGVNTASMKYFVDFAAQMEWEYQLVDWWWYGKPFSQEWVSNPDADITTVVPELDMAELIRYARERGVGILLWLEWSSAEQQMEQAFPLYERWGVAGVKVDFMQRDDQEMVNFYHRLVRLAAKHHLVVDFHGSYKPTGIRRTLPNLLTREGVLGNEYNKWSERVTPEHNVTLPFTRMLCGPMDYTPGGFRNKSAGDFRAVGDDVPGPFVMGTRCHQLAMMVVYESPLQVCCDSPYNYRASPAGLEILKSVPTTWDDSRVLQGRVGEYIVMARRSGGTWFLGGMNGSTERELGLELDFLGSGQCKARLYLDPDEADDYPDRVWQRELVVRSTDVLDLRMAPGGGFVAVISPAD